MKLLLKQLIERREHLNRLYVKSTGTDKLCINAKITELNLVISNVEKKVVDEANLKEVQPDEKRLKELEEFSKLNLVKKASKKRRKK